MLNRFKIGTKLITGFLLILFLLLVVAACGYFGLTESAKTTEDVLELEDLQSRVLDMRGLMLRAQIATANGSLTRNDEFKKAREVSDVKLDEIAESIREELSDANKQNLANMKTAYLKFTDIDNDWYAQEASRKIHEATQVSNARIILDTLADIRDRIANAMKTPEEAHQNGGKTFFTEDRVNQLAQAEHCLTLMQAIRRNYAQFFSELDAKEKENLSQRIQEGIAALRHDLEQVGARLITPEGKKSYKDASEALDKWQDAFTKNIACLNRQKEIEAGEEVLLADVESAMAAMIDVLKTRTQEIRNNARLLDEFIIRTILCISIGAFIFGLVISFLLSRNIKAC